MAERMNRALETAAIPFPFLFFGSCTCSYAKPTGPIINLSRATLRLSVHRVPIPSSPTCRRQKGKSHFDLPALFFFPFSILLPVIPAVSTLHARTLGIGLSSLAFQEASHCVRKPVRLSLPNCGSPQRQRHTAFSSNI